MASQKKLTHSVTELWIHHWLNSKLFSEFVSASQYINRTTLKKIILHFYAEYSGVAIEI